MTGSTLDEVTTTLKHPVSQTTHFARRVLLLSEDHNHRPQEPIFRRMMDKQIKAVVTGIEKGRTPQIRKIEFSRDYLWKLKGCIGK
jgi:hypothetical protein